MTSERPDTVHGRLMEAVHLSSYSFERACSELEWLLEHDRWRQVGGGFPHINGFLSTIDLSGFRIAVEQRKEIAKRLKSIEASQRATARMLGVNHRTIGNDLGENSPREPSATTQANGNGGEDSPAWFQDKRIKPARLAKAKAETHGAKAARRAAREAELARNILALPTKKYGVILEDYEWDHETWSERGGNCHASNHYPTSTDAHTPEEIVERTKDRFQCAADDCVLFMWTTAPHLAIAIDVMRLRGFRYRTNFVWGKNCIGTGFGTGTSMSICSSACVATSRALPLESNGIL